MNSYDFSTLNDKEFEQITRDLLNAKFNLGLQDFKAGRDKGIDLRFSTKGNDNAIVVQAKHYIRSEFAQLKHTLLKVELIKIRLLNPDRYLVVTSLQLSASQKDELKAGLAPFVHTSNDIIGQEDLNVYLAQFNDIEKKHFKLWFSSINVLNTVFNNAIEGRTKYLMHKIKEKIPFYVVTKQLADANKILQDEKLLLITGQPGIGKTTLAEVILLERAKNGFEVYCVENIREAEDVMSIDNDKRQIFYFDDFLGANYFEILSVGKTENQITSFVERVKNTPNKYLVLTTRTVILNHAIGKYEKIYRSNLASNQFEIKLTDYNIYEKALILYNHLYFRGIKKEFYESILNQKFYKKIIEHKNYTPRIIEFITDNTRISSLNPDAYLQFILNNLSNPKEIWRYSFNNQIGYLDRCLLMTLFTLGDGSFRDQLMSAYESRLEYEKVEHNQIVEANQFDESIKILLNGFIASNLYNSVPPVREFRFINPSLTDFLIGHVAESYAERKSIISSVRYIEQLSRFDPKKSIFPLEKELQGILRDRISQSRIVMYDDTSKDFTETKGHAILAEALCKYCNEVNIDAILLKHLSQVSFEEQWFYLSSKIEYVLLNIGDAPQAKQYIHENFFKIIEKLLEAAYDAESGKLIPEFFRLYDQDYDEYLSTEEGFEKVDYAFREIMGSIEGDIKHDHKNATDIDDVGASYEESNDILSDLESHLFPHFIFLDGKYRLDMDEDDWLRATSKN